MDFVSVQRGNSGAKGEPGAIGPMPTLPYINVQDYGALGDGVSDDSGPISLAIAAVGATGGTVVFPITSSFYRLNSEIIIPSGKLGLTLLGLNRYVSLRFYGAAVNGIRLVGEADNLTIENLELRSASSSSGTAFLCNNTGSSSPLRDLIIRNVNISDFKNGIAIYGHLNILVEGGRQGGQGAGVSGGVGIKLGYSVSQAGNQAILRNVYVSNFDIDIHNVYSSPVVIENSLTGLSNTSIQTESTSITYIRGHYFDSYNDYAIKNAGYMTYDGQKSSLGNQYITTSNHRFTKTGHDKARVIVSRGSTNQLLATGTTTKISFNAETEDSESHFDSTTNYRFTAKNPGFYYVSAFVQWRCGTVFKQYAIYIYKNGSSFKENIIHGPSPVVAPITSHVDSIVWLDTNEYIEIYARHEEGVNAEIYFGSDKTYLTIVEQ